MRMNQRSKKPSFQLQPMCAAVLLAFSVNASANPNGGVVVNGGASFNTSGNTLTVTNTPGTIINWQDFSINSNEITHFAQQSASSAVLNRVITNNPSVILGTLSSNGRVFLVNPGGIVFGAGSTVNVAGMVATSLNLSDADFLAGRGNFTLTPGAQAVSNTGNITAQSGGEIYLIAPNVENSGVITAPNGEILLIAGHEVQLVNTLDPNLRINITAPAGDATNVGQLVASAGRLGLFGTVVKNTGAVSADSATMQGGKIVFKASQRVELGGTVSANGTSGGSVNIAADHSADLGAPGSVIHTGSIQTRGTTGAGGVVNLSGDSIFSSAGISTDGTTTGGQISVQASNRTISTASAQYTANSTQGRGGDILVAATVSNYTSGSYSATGVTGGNLTLAGNEIKLAGTSFDARGTNGGGNVHIGGLMHGTAGFGAQGVAFANASNVLSNSATSIKADARQSGNGGEVVLWSDQTMRFMGNISAKGGVQSGNGGNAEISGLTSLGYGGLTDLSATNGLNGTLLLDPRNITIVAGSGATPYSQIFDPTPFAGEGFGGMQNLVLSSGNIVVASPYDSAFGTNSGAVYFYNSTGTLLSALVGSAAGDKVGGVTSGPTGFEFDQGGIKQLANGNVVVFSNNWNVGRGAVTWMNGMTGALSDGSLGAAVANTNSLIGTLAGDQAGMTPTTSYNFWIVHDLANSNVGILSSNWGAAGVAANALGAVTWMSGTTGKLSDGTNGGEITLSNSLVGEIAGDKIGLLINGGTGVGVYGGNLLVGSQNWNSSAGALTWMSGATGLLSDGVSTGGWISSTNSLVGSVGDGVGTGITPLSNGNLMIWTQGWGLNSRGAITWMNGATGGLSDGTNGGVVSAANSLVGGAAGDLVGQGYSMEVTNGTYLNYIVHSKSWGSNFVFANSLGAVTWVNGANGLLSDGTAGGIVSASNSLIGFTAGDIVGTMTLSPSGFSVDQTGLLAVGNGNLVVVSNNWDNGAAIDAGAVTWMNGATGKLSNNANGGVIAVTNSLVGSTSYDKLGTAVPSFAVWDFLGLTVLSNGNLVVSSNYWDNGAVSNAGAVTWMSGASGLLSDGVSTGGTVSVLNSLVGSTAEDRVGGNHYNGGLAAELQFNGNLVIGSPTWDNGAAVNAGAVTWINGTTGRLADGSNGGAVSVANSLVGSSSNDAVGATSFDWSPANLNFIPQILGNGNVIIASNNWTARNGALTWMNGATGLLSDGVSAGGVVSASNSLLGSTANDFNTSNIHQFLNGNILIQNMTWDNGVNVDAGALTWMNAATGVLSDGTLGGTVTQTNSLVSVSGGSSLGSGSITELGNGKAVISSPYWANGAITGAGAATWMNSANGRLSDASTGGAVSAANSLIGSTASDSVSSNGVIIVTDNSTYWNYVVLSSAWDNGAATDAGAITWMNGVTGKTFDAQGTISSANSIVGTTVSDAIGFNGWSANSALLLGNGNVVFASSSWNGGMGAVTWMKGLDGTLADATNGGQVSATNSLVGSAAGDQIGSGGLTLISNYSTYWNYAVSSPNWSNGAATGAGAITLGNGAAGTVGVVSASNSLVGSATGDAVGSGGIRLIGNGHFVVSSPDWSGGGTMYSGLGAVTWVNGQTGALSTGSIGGVVGSTNSLVGSALGDRVGLASTVSFNGLSGINTFVNGNLLIRSEAWGGGPSFQGSGRSALSWMNGTTGRLAGGATGGAVSAANSLLGSTLGDNLGGGEVGLTELLVNGNWVITSANWGNASNWGAATWMNSTNGQLADGTFGGVLSAANSLVGSATTPSWIDLFCDCGTNGTAGGIKALSDGNYVAYWQNFTPDVGAVTWGNGTVGSVGALTSSNSLFEFVNPVLEMPGSPGKILVGSKTANGGAGALYILGGATSVMNSNLFFATTPDADATVAAGWISSTLNLGTNVVLQAHNDITQQTGASISATGAGGLTLQAGRSVVLNDSINIAGALNVTANDAGADIQIRSVGAAVIDASLATINAGLISMNNSGGDILAGSMSANTGALNLVASGIIQIGVGRSLSSSGGNITLSADVFDNASGANPFNTTGRWLIYSSDPLQNTLGGITPTFKRYNCTYAGGCLTAGTSVSATGNGLLYAVAPTLAIDAAAQSRLYGQSDSLLTYSITSGLIDGDTASTIGLLTGTLGHTGTENVLDAHTLTQGSLASSMGYGITFTGGTLNITPAPLTVVADSKNKVLGTPDPLLTYMTYGLKLNDTAATTVGGALKRDVGDTIGTYAINQGTLALLSSNYTMTYVAGTFRILAPTVVQEITQTTVGSPPVNEKKDTQESNDLLAEAATTDDSGQALAAPLPVCP